MTVLKKTKRIKPAIVRKAAPHRPPAPPGPEIEPEAIEASDDDALVKDVADLDDDDLLLFVVTADAKADELKQLSEVFRKEIKRRLISRNQKTMRARKGMAQATATLSVRTTQITNWDSIKKVMGAEWRKITSQTVDKGKVDALLASDPNFRTTWASFTTESESNPIITIRT